MLGNQYTTRAKENSSCKVNTHYEIKNKFHDQYFKHWLAGLPKSVAIPSRVSLPTIIAVGGGKGGVGKSVVSSNLSAKMAGLGNRVLTIDLDIGGANLHTYFGQKVSNPSLSDFIFDDSISFESIITNSSVHNVSLVTSGQSNGLGALRQSSLDMSRIWNSIITARSKHGFDVVILDLGAGTDDYTTEFFLGAHVGVVTILPEPTSIENAYTFLKAALWKIIQNAGARVNQNEEAANLGELIFSSESGLNVNGYLQKLLSLRASNPKLINCIIGAMMGRRMGFLVNQIRSQKDIEIAGSMSQISSNYFGWKTLSLGFLNYDESAWKALRNKKLLVEDFPHSMMSRKLDEVIVRIFDGIR